MDFDVIRECIPRCLQFFDRDNYASEYARFLSVCREYLAEPRRELPDDVMAYAGELTKKRLGANARLFDLRSFLCVYLCPAAVECGYPELSEAIIRRWNEHYPKLSLELGSFEDIASGFRTRPFGV